MIVGRQPITLGGGAPSRRPRRPLDRSRLAAPQIYETLRERIVSVELAPGTLLSRASLQAEFGVSQTPLRDALMKLDVEGLVEIYPQHATVVARIDVGAARQAHFLRQAIEIEAARRVPPARRAALAAEMREAIAAQRRLSALDDRAGFVEADLAFHRALYDAAAVPDLWQFVRRRSGHIDRLRCLNLPMAGKVETIIADHEAIVAALERGDGDAAAEALRCHLSGTLAIVNDIRARYPDYLLEE